MQSISFKMQFTVTFTTLLSALDFPITDLAGFHIPYTTMLEYTCVLKEAYKDLLKVQMAGDTRLEAIQKPFEQLELLLRLLLSAGGDTVLIPALEAFTDAVHATFGDIVMEKSVQSLFRRTESLIRLLGLMFGIERLKLLKIE